MRRFLLTNQNILWKKIHRQSHNCEPYYCPQYEEHQAIFVTFCRGSKLSGALGKNEQKACQK